MIIYLDVLIFENFIINSFLLYITSQLMKIKIKVWALSIGSLLGSLYVITYLFDSKIASLLPIKLLVSFIMIYVTYRGKKIKNIIWGFLILISLSALMAGFCISTAAWNGLNFNFSRISYKNILFGIMLTYILIWQIIYYVREKKGINILLYNVEIGSKYGSAMIKCFLDTGNNLKEPVTKIPVILINKSCIKDFIINEKDMVKIPYITVGNSKNEIDAFRADYIKIYSKKHIYEDDAFIGLTDNKFSAYEEYDGLLPRQFIINGGIS